MATLIFDFDGTLADTFFISVDVFRKLAPKGTATHDKEIEILRGMSARAVFKRIGVKWWQVPLIVYYARREVRMQIDDIKPFPGIKQVVHTLHGRGHTLLILSTNKKANIKRFLSNTGMDAYFDHVYADIGLFAKARNLRKIMREHKLGSSECYYVGDEVRDFEASEQVGMRCISVAWGYNNAKALRASHAKTIIMEPKALLTAIGK